MIKYLKNTSGSVLRLPAIKKKFPVDYVWQIPYSEIDVVMTSLDTLTSIRNGDLQVGWSDTDFFLDETEGESFLLDTFIGVNTVIDSTNNINEFIPGIITDSETGKKTTSVFFQILRILRELYNEADNPLFKSGFETILDKLTTMTSTIGTIQTDVANNTGNITTNSDNITTLQTDVTNNIGDISTLQTDVANNTGNITTNSGDISTLQTDVANNTGNITTNSGDISTLQTDVANNIGDIDTLQTNVSNNTSNISTLQTNVATNSGNITTLQTDVSNNTNDITINSGDISSILTSIASLTDIKQHLERPHDLLIYYGWLNSFNSDVNSWNNEKVAQDMARYNIIVIGDGIQDSGHGDYANTQIIIPRIKELNPNALIFGYVTIYQSLVDFQSKADGWDTLEIDGIFLDEAGYDYGTTITNSRDAFNTKVDYVHSLNYATICFANSWNMDHIIGTENDVSYPNTTWNTSITESNLNENDWYLLESFAVNSVSYTNNYEASTDWFARGNKAITHRDFYDINIASVSIIENTEPAAVDLFHFVFTSGLMYSLDAVGTSDVSYGAGTAKVIMWDRPDISGLGRVWASKPNVLSDLTDADAYIRFTDFGKLSVDFTDGSEDSEIIKN